MPDVAPSTLIVEPRRTPKGLLLAVHGYERDEVEMATLARLLDPDGHLVVVAPRGPLGCRAGGHGWMRPRDRVPAQYPDAVAALDVLVDEVGARYGVGRATSAVVGFSQGGALALAVALRAHDDPTTPAAARWGAAVTLCGPSPHRRSLPLDPARAAGLPVLVVATRDDAVVALPHMHEARDALGTLGATVRYVELAGGHEIGLDALVAARDHLAEALGPDCGG